MAGSLKERIQTVQAAPTLPGPPPRDAKARDRRTVLAIAIYAGLLGAVLWHMQGAYFWQGHDEYFPAYRTQQMVEVWRTGGGFFARWMADACYGYGWPFFLFYAPFGYWIAGGLHWVFGFDFGVSVRLSFFLSLMAGGGAMGALGWLLSRRSGSRRPEFWGLAAATLFTFAPYHMADVFVRSALAECWAWPFLAGALLGAELLRTRPAPGSIIFALSVAGLTFSHNIMALYGCTMIALYGLLTAPWRVSGIKWIVRLALGGTLGIGLASCFWLPVLVHIRDVQAQHVNAFYGSPEWLGLHALYWPQFFIEQWNFGASRAGMDDTLPLNPGLLTVTGGFAAAVAAFAGKLDPGSRRRVMVCVGLGLLLMFAMTHAMPWQYVPGMFRYIQFPWRLEVLLITFFVVALAGGSGAVEKALSPWIFILFPAAIAIWMLSSVLVKPGSEVTADAQLVAWHRGQELNEGLIAGCNGGEYRPVWAAAHFTDPHWQAAHPAPRDRITASTETLAVHAFGREGARYRWLLEATADTTATLHVFDFPGWVLKIDGVSADYPLARTADGLISVRIPPGEYKVVLIYTEPPIVASAALVSWTALALLGIWLALESRWAHRRARGAPAHA